MKILNGFLIFYFVFYSQYSVAQNKYIISSTPLDMGSDKSISSKNYVDYRLKWPKEGKILVQYTIPLFDQEENYNFKEIPKLIIEKIKSGKIKYHQEGQNKEWDNIRKPEDITLILKKYCSYYADSARCSTGDYHTLVTGNALWGLFYRNLKTGKIYGQSEIGIIASYDETTPKFLILTVKVKDLKNIELAPGVDFLKWYKSLNYSWVAEDLKDDQRTKFCDFQNREDLISVRKIIRSGNEEEVKNVKTRFKDCSFSITVPSKNLYKFRE